MKDTNLGGFEELVLLSIATQGNDAYSISIKNLLKERTGRTPSIGALHSALMRLEEKGFIESFVGGATSERGGRRKRFYRINKHGMATLALARDLRNQFYLQISEFDIT